MSDDGPARQSRLGGYGSGTRLQLHTLTTEQRRAFVAVELNRVRPSEHAKETGTTTRRVNQLVTSAWLRIEGDS